MSLGKKIGIGFMLLLLLFAGLNIHSLIQMKTLSSLTQRLYKHPLAVSNAVRDINYQVVCIQRDMKDVVLADNEKQVHRAVASIESAQQSVLQSFDILQERFLGDKSKILEARQIFIDWKPIRDEVIALVSRDSERKYSQNPADA